MLSCLHLKSRKNEKRKMSWKGHDAQVTGKNSVKNTLKSLEKLQHCGVAIFWANKWNKIYKSSKTREEKKSLRSTFPCFLTAITKV